MTGTGPVNGLADRIAQRAAFGVSRRRFLRNAGAGALGLSLSAAVAGTELSGVAYAHGSSSHPCGPSPVSSASASSCPCYSNGDCNDPCACGRRYYSTYTCGNVGGFNNCWQESYSSGSYAGTWRCCDICVSSGTGSVCSGGCNQYAKRAEICRHRIA